MLMLDQSVYAPVLAAFSGDWDQNSGNLSPNDAIQGFKWVYDLPDRYKK